MKNEKNESHLRESIQEAVRQAVVEVVTEETYTRLGQEKTETIRGKELEGSNKAVAKVIAKHVRKDAVIGRFEERRVRKLIQEKLDSYEEYEVNGRKQNGTYQNLSVFCRDMAGHITEGLAK